VDDHEDNLKWERTHFKVLPEKRDTDDRRHVNCFLENDRRSGIGCRRKLKQIEKERKLAFSKVIFHPEYFRID
jgi:hypothetical protein